jgi:hypothetical protein
MATVDLLSFSLLDDAGNTANVHVYVASTYTLAQLQTFVEQIAPDLDAITGSKINTVQVTKALTLPAGLKAAATANSRNPWGANMAYDAANTDYRHTIRIPAILPSLLAGDKVDDTEAAIITFNTQVTTGDGVVSPTDRYANDLSAFLEGIATFRKA